MKKYPLKKFLCIKVSVRNRYLFEILYKYSRLNYARTRLYRVMHHFPLSPAAAVIVKVVGVLTD